VKRSWHKRTLAAAVTLTCALLLVAGCSRTGNEFQRLVCEVQQVNEGNPLMSAYVIPSTGASTPDIFPIDSVPVLFAARPYNSSVTIVEGAPYSSFHITSYDLTWRPLSAAGDSLRNYSIVGGAAEVLVPVNGEASTSILVADRTFKDTPWFMELLTGERPSFTAVAEIRFHGHETGSNRDIIVPASLTVTFVGAATE
jgi:hypothetical protein